MHLQFTSVAGPIGIHNCTGSFLLHNRDCVLQFILKGVRYHITNEAVIGACFLAGGLGSMGW